MLIQSNEEFLEYVSRNYPDIDWDNLPENSKIFVIEGKGLEKRIFKSSGNESSSIAHFVIGVEYPTKELAEVQLKKMHETWPATQTYEHSNWTDIDYVMPDSWVIVEKYSMKDSELDTIAMIKENIDVGVEVFPLYLP